MNFIQQLYLLTCCSRACRMGEQQNNCCEEGAIQLLKGTCVPFRQSSRNHGFNGAATLVQVKDGGPCSEDDFHFVHREFRARCCGIVSNNHRLSVVGIQQPSKDLTRMTRRLVAGVNGQCRVAPVEAFHPDRNIMCVITSRSILELRS